MEDFLASLREEEDDQGHDEGLVGSTGDVHMDETAKTYVLSHVKRSMGLSPHVKILYFASEGTPVTRRDVMTYKTQLTAASNPSLSLNAVSAVAAPARSFSLSDEAGGGASGADKQKLEMIISQLQFDVQPLVRAWTVIGGNMETMLTQYYNYGLNEQLLKEYLEQQIVLRMNRAQRQRAADPQHGGTSQFRVPVGHEAPQKAVYVTGFPAEYGQAELQNLFMQTGGIIESVAIMTKKTYASRTGTGFVNFASVEDASRAVHALNGMPVPGTRDEFRLNCSFARPKAPRQ
jgi:hypothetical protein